MRRIRRDWDQFGQSDGASWSSRIRALAIVLAMVMVMPVTAPRASAQATQSASLTWVASPDPNAEGYFCYYGPSSGNYTNRVDAGEVTSATITGLVQGATYYFVVTAYDVEGDESVPSNEVNYTVPISNPPPAVALTSPINGTTYASPAAISLAATVTTNGHSITSIQFYNCSTLIGGSTSAPYSFAWTKVSAGTYTLTAHAIYDSGSSVASSAASVTVTNPPPIVALTSPTNAASYTAPAAISLAATVTTNGHSITSIQFYNGSTLLGGSTSAPYGFTWTNVSTGSYNLMAQAFYDGGSAVASSPVAITVMGLAAPWQTTDIGTVSTVGNASLSNGLWTVSGAGNISGTADSFRFVYQPLSGNGQVQACLSSATNTGKNARIGIMIRESLTSGSRYAFTGLRAGDDSFRWQSRSQTGGSTAGADSGSGTPPNTWVRLVRTGNLFYGYSSIDGTNWTALNSRSITMTTNIWAGLVVASGGSNTLNTATFLNVNVVP